MSKYLVRIELHQPRDKEPYERLHEIMKGAGFKRTIVIDGVEYHLPDAEYIGAFNMELSDLLVGVQKLAAHVPAKESPGIFIVPFDLYVSSGLKKVETSSSLDVAELLRKALAKK